MSRTIRNILFVFFVILFFVSAVALVLYASGYRYHFSKKSFEKTGQIIVETEPRGALLLINGAPAKRDFSQEALRTPTTVSYLLSGDYDISIEKEGFYPVSRTVSIAPGKTAILNDVVLIKKSDPVSVIVKKGIRGVAALDGGIMYYDTRSLYVFDEHQDKERILTVSPRDIGSVEPSRSGRMVVLYDTKKKWSVVDQGAIRLSEKDVPTVVRQFRWSGDELYVRTDDGIGRVDVDKKVIVPIVVDGGVKDFFIDGDLFVLREKPAPNLARIDKKTGVQIREVTAIPAVQSIVKEHGTLLVLKGSTPSSFYLFDTTSQRPLFQEVRDARDIVFNSPESFFSFNDFELWRHQWQGDRYLRTLITRQSDPIESIVPLTKRSFIILATKKGTIRIRDLYAENSPETELARMDRIDALFFNSEETSLWVAGSREGKDGLFSISLIEEESLFPLVK